MAEFPAMPLWTDAYIADTQHLTNEEHGVYLRLLMFAWRSPGCCLPDDDRRLALMVGVTPRVWAKLKPVVMSFWTLDDGVWEQKRLMRELDFVRKNREQKRTAGKASAEARALKNNESPSTAAPTAEKRGDQRNASNPDPHPSSEERKDSSLRSESQRKSQGTRLPSGWEPTFKDIAFAQKEGFDDDEIASIAADFTDYWIAQPGQSGRKVDWSATWRRWIRKQRRPSRSTGYSHAAKTDRMFEGLRRSALKNQAADSDRQEPDWPGATVHPIREAGAA